MSKTNFMDELKAFNVKEKPSEFKNAYIKINFESEEPLTEEDIKVLDYLKTATSKLKSDETEFYVLSNGFLDPMFFCISSDFIMSIAGSVFYVLDTSLNYLYDFGYNFSTFFEIKNDNFNFTPAQENEKERFSISYCDRSKKNSKRIDFKLKNENTISISSSALGLTSITFNEDEIITTFKGTPYSTIILDFDFNIKTVDLNKTLKQDFDLKNTKKYHDIKNYNDLMNKIKESLSDEIELHALLFDKKFQFKGSENKFKRDLSYIKEITNNRKEMFDIFLSDRQDLKDIYEYYNPYTNIIRYYLLDHQTKEDKIEYLKSHPIFSKYEVTLETDENGIILSTYYHNILELLHVIKKNNCNFMNNDFINKYKKINEKISSTLKFNKNIINLESKNKKNKIGNIK